MAAAPITWTAACVQLAVASHNLTGESPFWHPSEQALYWVDIPAHRVQRWSPADDRLTHWQFATDVACCAPTIDGGLLLAMRDGLWRMDPATGERERLAKPPYDTATERFNDGKCDPQGRFWVGTIYEPRKPPLAALYSYEDETLERRADGITNSNGLAWSPDGRTMYWSDTTAHTIFAMDFDPVTSRLGPRRVFHAFAQKHADGSLAGYGGRPDGGTVDSEGCYWASMFEGQRLVRLSPDGGLLLQIELPVRCPTMPCFGGPDLKTLYVTTARENRPAAELADQPWAGCVLSLRVDVPGLPAWTFSR